ncbi:PaaI family thioesterase [soil metagenome]
MATPLEMIRSLGNAAVQGSPHAKALGLEFVEADVGRAVLKAPYREDLVGDPETGVIAGGVVTALLDHVCGQAVWAALEGYTTIATLDLRIDYMRAAEPGLPVFAEAHCYKLTRSVAFVRATAYDRDPSDPVAAAQASFMLNSNAGRKAGANLKPRVTQEPPK